MRAYALTNVGRVRQINEDSYYLPRVGERFAAVADGMGGHRAGEVASALAIEEFIRWLRCAPRPDEETMRYAVSEANRAIFFEAKVHAEKAGMGTTLTALWLEERHALLAHVGDSRAYRLRDGVLEQMTQDHSLVGEMVAQGKMTPEEARVHPHRHYITRALGTNLHVKPDVARFESKADDVWLLCSDGMTNHVTDEEMAQVLRGEKSWPEKLEDLVSLALKRGGTDNITVVLLLCEGVLV